MNAPYMTILIHLALCTEAANSCTARQDDAMRPRPPSPVITAPTFSDTENGGGHLFESHRSEQHNGLDTMAIVYCIAGFLALYGIYKIIAKKATKICTRGYALGARQAQQPLPNPTPAIAAPAAQAIAPPAAAPALPAPPAVAAESGWLPLMAAMMLNCQTPPPREDRERPIFYGRLKNTLYGRFEDLD